MEPEIVEEPNLLDNLAIATENKPPSTFTGTGWEFNIEDSEIQPDAQGSETSAADHEQIKKNLTKPRVSEAEKIASAETATACFDAALEMTCVPIIKHKFKKKVKPADMVAYIEKLEVTPDVSLNETELLQKRTIDRYLKERDKKIAGIPLNPTELKGVNSAFLNYYKVTDKAIGPEVLLYMRLGSILIDRTIDVITD